MAGWFSTKDLGLTEGQRAIRAKLDEAKAMLAARQADVIKAQRHFAELQDTCVRLHNRIKLLERDEAALSADIATAVDR